MSTPTPANTTPAAPAAAPEAVKPSNFLRQIIEADLDKGTYASRHWAGSPGDAAHHAAGQPDPAKIRTRFPPEPNGYLHIGHAKSICINFGLARDYGGVCHLRFDDTNPEKEDTEYVNSIKDAVQWLGFGWNNGGESNLYQASDYFGFMYRAAEYLIEAGHAYVDEQTAEQMRVNRGDFGKPGVDSPFRTRTPAENLARFREMRDGKHEDGSMVLRAKIDMASPNINMRDPAIYRIRRATHHNTGDTWCIYPMYTYAHPIEDALEQITHSLCTLEFEDQRPFYDWLLERLTEGGLLASPPPRQYEFARLNLTYVITSKRKLAQLVYDHKVSGWDDPRMPTIVGLRRRGYTPAAIQTFADRIGVTKSDSWIDYSTLEGCLREDLELKAHRGMAVLNPVKLVLTNWDDVMGAGHLEPCTLPALPHAPHGASSGAAPEGVESPERHFTIGKEVWIEREDFEEVPPKGYKRLFPGNKVRLKGGYVIECTGANKDADGHITEVLATVVPDTKSGTPGADTVKVKAAITWVGVADGVNAEVRMYDRLFLDAHPDAGGKDFIESLNPNSLKVVTAIVEPSLANAKPDDKFQFERHGYFVADRVDHRAEKPVFNLAVGLKDSWGK
ncbi:MULTISPECIES: glutamine--tRNA ligase/YqeY domain fusion protein [unclassified Acidovorax]|jgi:glutaminyl-tRNA synthetase|uniref:glutamine--tRNA ligase/YqeY domain fusion protein n=1 Tax=unclassified Acidovorax TaxID=2684926 RepID=UPI000BD3A46B|nr:MULTISPECIES: glutamine--tRNA ligase/YqeY domain fusion protein [unclassified Acidovorax]HQS21336.1 glutamine--tRNA ligase/YqeY domain fusion protein [Acidovorax defluvii]OYY27979.1 MAG: glutamine--tRNA ligase [Acidovorax sp. 35-64-16]OYZ71456.1 MAG: glutamine--tRNA ligase [Acidovorax sp. 24-64-9]OZA69986.1 MAG: glutamine--tRNA ligase [Acidovorax sp. 39-64-12]HQS62842.1 glutamine--tRNA ligase/YqeY domain fusion protein [Acidovorax defluvii]